MNIYSIEFEGTCYVGISKNPKTRLSKHTGYAIANPNKNEKSKWFFSLYEKGITPKLIILETDVIDIAERETYWIEQKRSKGFTVINVRKGGGGCMELTEEQKSKITLNRKPKTISERLKKANSERNNFRNAEIKTNILNELRKVKQNLENTELNIKITQTLVFNNCSLSLRTVQKYWKLI